MSEVNKLGDKNCSFDPEKYKVTYKTITTVELSNDVTAPVGSFAWAIIQLNLNKLVGRKDWNSLKQYLLLNEESGYIEEYDKDKNRKQWIPKPEDMMACDWQLEEDCMLVFDLTVTKRADEDDNSWGACLLGCNTVSFGDIKIIKNNTPFMKIAMLYWMEYVDNDAPMLVFIAASPDVKTAEKASDFLGKYLRITVDGVSYNFGKNQAGTYYIDDNLYGSTRWY